MRVEVRVWRGVGELGVGVGVGAGAGVGARARSRSRNRALVWFRLNCRAMRVDRLRAWLWP